MSVNTIGQLTPLQTQVAGHQYSNGKSDYGMLHHPDGYVLKPVKKSALLENEIKFYEYLNSTSDPVTLDLKEYVPKFYGTRSLSIDGKDLLGPWQDTHQSILLESPQK